MKAAASHSYEEFSKGVNLNLNRRQEKVTLGKLISTPTPLLPLPLHSRTNVLLYSYKFGSSEAARAASLSSRLISSSPLMSSPGSLPSTFTLNHTNRALWVASRGQATYTLWCGNFTQALQALTASLMEITDSGWIFGMGRELLVRMKSVK